ncbi:MAG: phosphate ABC transporter substrate-binding protein [Phycisphaerae bacterium]|nr:phosphate ABC transporter substrate-binding protein [Phycisphaerae bacterium]
MRNLLRMIGWGVAAVLCGALGVSAMAQEKTTLQIEGSTTVGPIVDEFTEAFKKSPDFKDVTITVKKTGSGDGIAALIDGRCQIATSSRFMKIEEFEKAVKNGVMPVAHTVAMDGVCVVVHPSNPVKGLTVAQLKDIYTGKTTNWKDLGGADRAIVLISRDTSSGTYESFVAFVMGKDKMSDKAEYVNANPQAHSRVATTEGAIGYVGLGFLDKQVKALEIGGIMPSRRTIQSGKYPLSRPLFLFTNGYPDLGTPIHAFCTHYLSEKGERIIDAKGFIPVTNY